MTSTFECSKKWGDYQRASGFLQAVSQSAAQREFALFMKALVERVIALRIDHQLQAASLGAFKQVLLHDGTSFAVHRRLAADFPGRFKTISPAAIECHMTMSLSEQSPLSMSVSADTAGERQFLPEAHKLANCLLLADAGYIDRAWFEQVNDAGGFYLVRGTQNLNPKIIQAWRSDGQEVPKLAGLSLKEAGRRRCRAEVLDMVVMHIPADHEHRFRFNVNTISGPM